MPPQDFSNARQVGEKRVFVDGKAYLPTVSLTITQYDSKDVQAAALGAIVARIFDLHPTSTYVYTLQVDYVEGGATNKLFRVSNIHKAFDLKSATTLATPLAPPNTVLFRKFGADGMIDRDVETSTFAALAQAGLAPPYHGAFRNGRLEGWMDGMRPLTPREMAQPDISRQVAVALARLHYEFVLPGYLQPHHKEPSLWKQLNEWYAQALGNTYEKSDRDRERAKDLKLEQLEHELEWLKSSVIPLHASSSLCHNDVLAANILCCSTTHEDENDKNDNTTTTTIQLIDFEYGGCNYRSFDIANHWNEYAGGPPDSAIPNFAWLPTSEEQQLFLAAYVEKVHQINSVSTEEEQPKNSPPSARPLAMTVESLWTEVQGFVLVNHLYWGLWAVCQAGSEGCEDFDYMLYAKHRFQQYRNCKEQQQQSLL